MNERLPKSFFYLTDSIAYYRMFRFSGTKDEEVFADKILVLFGGQYSENATDLLRLLAIANFPFAINVLYFAQKRVEKKTTIIIILAVLSGAITIGLSELLLTGMGITGVGIAFLSGQGAIAVIIIIDWLKNRSIVRKSKT